MNRRTRDAKDNLSNWESLLSKARRLLSDTRSLQEEVRGSTDRIERAWDDTASDVERIQRDVSHRVDQQSADRDADAQFDDSDVAGAPPAVPDHDPIHGDPDLPDESDYEIPDPVSVDEVRAETDEAENRDTIEREHPVPFTEREWFELHSDQFPIGEDAFPVDVRDTDEASEAEGDRRTRESTGVRRRDRDEERDRGGDR